MGEQDASTTGPVSPAAILGSAGRIFDTKKGNNSNNNDTNHEKDCKPELLLSRSLLLTTTRSRSLTASSVSSFESDLQEEEEDERGDDSSSHQDDSSAEDENESMGCKSRLLLDYGPGSGHKAEPWMQKAWIVHFVVGFSVLVYSVWSNGGHSKYIPVDPIHSSEISGMKELGECHKVFVNVLASSSQDTGAVVCCPPPHGGLSNQSAPTILDLCPASPETEAAFPFLGRLSKFPEAWLIPLFPLLLRIAFRTYQTVLENGHLVLDTTFGVYSFRRLVFYFLLMQFRGWVLYVALNGIEDNLLNHHNNNDDEGSCWYHDWAQPTHSSCYGRKFDFSDHVVLYYAQLLPIALLEYVHSIHRPYWPFHCFRRIALPTLLSVGMMYLYFITFVGVYKTAAFFHTPSESLAGYAVSLLAHLPLCTLQCTNGIQAIVSLREYFFGPKNKVLLQ